ncbi:MAG TPA: transglycosylase SLT domain-containing protein [Rhizomicrobium sp.]
MSVDTSNATAAAGVDPARARVAGAIKQAAASTGVSFEYMLTTAKMESDFNPTAGASTSSARGLYQFIEQTWLGTVKEAGGQLGYGQYSDAIGKTSSGDYAVKDPAMRRSIMKLRDDPVASSAMAAILTQSNSFQLTGKIGRRPTDAELYMAHFLGTGGAAKLISKAEDSPNASAVRMFPSAAAANRSIFYDRTGKGRSVSEVYSVLSTRYAAAANAPATRRAFAMYNDAPAAAVTPNVAVASAGPPPSTAVAAVPAMDTNAFLSAFPDTRGAAPAVTVASASAPSDSAQPHPVFRSLFQADENAQPISSTVRELWGKSSSLTSVASASPAPSTGAPRPLDLFSDRDGTFSS